VCFWQVFEDMPQEMRSRFWYVLLERPDLAHQLLVSPQPVCCCCCCYCYCCQLGTGIAALLAYMTWHWVRRYGAMWRSGSTSSSACSCANSSSYGTKPCWVTVDRTFQLRTEAVHMRKCEA
jgi:hypothetical protein